MTQSCLVAVDTKMYAIDKLYTYAVPSAWAETLQVGCRVVVPFGRGNRRQEALVLALHADRSNGQTLKAVLDQLDEQPIVEPDDIRLLIYMREHLYCTLFDCLRAMLPTGLMFRLREGYMLTEGITEMALSQLQDLEDDRGEILKLFSMEKPICSYLEIEQALGTKSLHTTLDKLCNQGILRYHSNAHRRTQDKTERMYTLALEPEEAMKRVSRSAVRFDVVRALLEGEALSAADLRYMTGVSDGILRAMGKAGILQISQVEQLRTEDYTDVPKAPPIVLSSAQEQAYHAIVEQLQKQNANPVLLHGITGSGKTSVYIALIRKVLEQNQGAIVLVPEISLTTQAIRQYVMHFGDAVAVLHSALSAGERYDNWKKVKRGQAHVVIGTRSAVFAPVQNLGLLIMDEEHDAAYKSENTPRYHAREIAMHRTRQAGALLVLGSATPSVESYHKAQKGQYTLVSMMERYQGTALPEVIISDLCGQIRQGNDGSIGNRLRDEIASNLSRGKQTILFLNRRGNSRMMTCAMCGWVPHCPNCSTTLTYHSANERAMCHYCGYSMKAPTLCPECSSRHLYTEMPGTQKVEEELQTLFPKVRILRMDADSTGRKGSHERILKAFAKHRADILLGTQMVTKGLDFENVTLVGVLDADLGLFAQDYRAYERAFALMTQVIGRAGRRFDTGRAVIQTYHPTHEVILHAAKQDYTGFYQEEILRREALRCPPIESMFVLTAMGEQEQAVLEALMRLKVRMLALMKGQFADFSYPVLGPSPAVVVRISGRYRYHLMVRCPQNKRRREFIAGLLQEFAKDKRNRGIHLFADNDADSI